MKWFGKTFSLNDKQYRPNQAVHNNMDPNAVSLAVIDLICIKFLSKGKA